MGTLPAFATACTLASAVALSMLYGARANTWAVMTDELQVVRLALSIVDERSLVPMIHGEYYGAHSQLYPLLLAPLYGILDPTQAAAAAHVLNALLLASAGVPAFLLARSIAGSSAGYIAALLTVVSPWLVLSTTLLTENAAYAAFIWSVLLCQRTIARPSPGRDLVAIAGLLLAYAARTQLLVVAVALPLAILVHEVGLAVVRATPATRRVRSGIGRALAGHRVLVVAYSGALLLGGALATLGGLGGLVGNYSVPFEGELVPPGFWRAAVEHFDQVTLGVGVLPVVLAVSWVVTTVCLSSRREAYAFASILAVLVPLVTFQVTSFDLRFTPHQFIQDRYLAYLVPLFAVGCGAWLVQRERRRALIVSAAVAGAVVVALLRLAPSEDTVIFWAAPGATFRPALSAAASWIGMPDVLLLQCLAAVVISLALLASWRLPRAALVGVAVVAVAFGGTQVVHAYVRYAGPSMILDDVGPRTWIDDAVPAGESVALVPDDVVSPTRWWEAELWNRKVTRAVRVPRTIMPTPFPTLDVRIDDDHGVLAGPSPTDYVVVSADEMRFGLASARTAAAAHGLRLLRVDRPYRLSWAARNLTSDGWTTPEQPAFVRVFGQAVTGRRALSLTLAASSQSSRRVPFVIRAQGEKIAGTVDPGGARPPVEVTVCVHARSHVDIHLITPRGTRLRDGRVVGLNVEAVRLSRPWPCEVF